MGNIKISLPLIRWTIGKFVEKRVEMVNGKYKWGTHLWSPYIDNAAFSRKKTLLVSTLGLNLRKKLVKCYIWSIALYGAEIWTLRKVDQEYLEKNALKLSRRQNSINVCLAGSRIKLLEFSSVSGTNCLHLATCIWEQSQSLKRWKIFTLSRYSLPEKILLNTWKLLKSLAEEGWRRSVGPITWEIKYNVVSRRREISCIQLK